MNVKLVPLKIIQLKKKSYNVVIKAINLIKSDMMIIVEDGYAMDVE